MCCWPDPSPVSATQEAVLPSVSCCSFFSMIATGNIWNFEKHTDEAHPLILQSWIHIYPAEIPPQYFMLFFQKPHF